MKQHATINNITLFFCPIMTKREESHVAASEGAEREVVAVCSGRNMANMVTGNHGFDVSVSNSNNEKT